MAYTVTKLITNSYYDSGVVSREFESVSGSQLENGLDWLNEILGKKVVESDMIPYESATTFTGVIGQEDYFIANLISVDTLTYVNDDVRYAVTFQNRNRFRGTPRVEDLTTLPGWYFVERTLGGATISLYALPNLAYEFTINGTFRLANVTLNQDLELTLDLFYISYLKYALAAKICAEYNQPIPSGVATELAEYELLISKQSRPLDMTIDKISTLSDMNYIDWPYVNLGKGWVP